jgi:hypothetical protein
MAEIQQQIVQAFCQNHESMSVIGRPGAGKTTTLLRCATEGDWDYPVVLTFSKATCDDIKWRAAKVLMKKELENDGHECPENATKKAKSGNPIEEGVMTFHGCVHRLFANIPDPCRDDIALVKALDTLLECKGKKIDALIVDEAQDLREHMALLLQKIMEVCCTDNCVVMFAGDPNQTVHSYHPRWPATADYMLEPGKYFGKSLSARDWKTYHLSYSFRLPRSTARVINCIRQQERGNNELDITGRPDAIDMPKSMRLAKTDANFKALMPHIHSSRYQTKSVDGGMAILANTVTGKTISRLTAKLKEHRIPFVVCKTGSDVRECIKLRSVCVSSFCMAKGYEFQHTYVYASHESVWGLYSLTDPFPNSFYVAITRHKQLCTIFWLKSESGPGVMGCMDHSNYTLLPSKATFNGLLSLENWEAYVEKVEKTRKRRKGSKRAVKTYSITHSTTRFDIGLFKKSLLDVNAQPIEGGDDEEHAIRPFTNPDCFNLVTLLDLCMTCFMFYSTFDHAMIDASVFRRQVSFHTKMAPKKFSGMMQVLDVFSKKRKSVTGIFDPEDALAFFTDVFKEKKGDAPPYWVCMAIPYLSLLKYKTRHAVIETINSTYSSMTLGVTNMILDIIRTLKGKKALLCSTMSNDTHDISKFFSVASTNPKHADTAEYHIVRERAKINEVASGTTIAFHLKRGKTVLYRIIPFPTLDKEQSLGKPMLFEYCLACSMKSALGEKQINKTRGLAVLECNMYMPPEKAMIKKITECITNS